MAEPESSLANSNHNFQATFSNFAKPMTIDIFLILLSIAGAAVPFALNNSMNPDGVFGGYYLFRCPECLSFWLSLITLMLLGINPIFAGIAPILARFISKTLYL